MWKQMITLLFSLALVAAMPLTALSAGTDWSVKADYAESCSCSPSCPCVFGSKPTLGYCDGTSMVEITTGQYGDVNLDGITVIGAFGTGKWVKFYVSDNATDQQVQAVEKLMPSMFPYHQKAEKLGISKAPLTVVRTETNLKYSAPDTNVEIERMKGHDGGPIKLTNLPVEGFPGPAFLDLEQYKSVSLSHQGEDKKFSYSGTNGFVAKIDAHGTSDL